MRLYRLAQNMKSTQNMLQFWHATIPNFAEQIQGSGKIVPAVNLPNQNIGWNFDTKELGFEYDTAVYLANSPVSALYYAKLRLRKLWENLDTEIDELTNDENLRFVGVFSVMINAQSQKLKKGQDEAYYFGEISNQPNPEAYWQNLKWISCEAEADQYYERLVKVNSEFLEEQG